MKDTDWPKRPRREEAPGIVPDSSLLLLGQKQGKRWSTTRGERQTGSERVFEYSNKTHMHYYICSFAFIMIMGGTQTFYHLP